MSLSNATENAALKMFLQGTDPSYRAGAGVSNRFVLVGTVWYRIS